MKKLILSLLFLCSVMTPASFGQAFDGGLLGGMSVNQIDGDMYAGYNLAGATAGAWIRTAPGNRTRLQLELKYYQKGSSPKAAPGIPAYPKTRLHYMELPVLMHLQLARRFSAQVGAAGGYLVKAVEDINGNGYLPVAVPFRNFELSAQAGAGFNILDHLQFEFRFSYSLLPVRLNPGTYVRYRDKGQYNNSLAFYLYYTINRRK